ncbi:HAMP domain-containing histidine kinase [Myxococcus sp. K38C18041901]|uniref:sensor histidine kinase n=1 Tax=Myxococcus guangdongensis TaxID=2906760 RepID=UPI0020A80F6F|nr:HAMP domain-containing sensor histidine kinase [Myxococcus guangdongensis]MCP3064155.1 HAMP domain-containing histidine kinase [Myxococcus guangdongensis]
MAADSPPRTRDTLVRRLSRAMLGLALTTTALTAGATGLLAYQMLRAAEDRRLNDVATDMVEEVVGLDDAQARLEADAEQTELQPFGIHITLFAGDTRLGGASHIAPVVGCAWADAPGLEDVRRCGIESHGRLAVAQETLGSMPRIRLGLGLAVVLTSVGAALMSLVLSRRVARWAARPLTELGESLARLQPGADIPADLHAEARYEEVNTVRAAMVGLLGRLHTALAQSRRFSANAAHELRTPLATLRAELELQSEMPQPHDTAAALARMHRTVTSLGTLVERLLVLAEGAEGPLELMETVSLAEVVEAALHDLPQEHRGRVHADLQTPGLIAGDGQLLRQLVDNVVENALKFSGEGRVFVDLTSTPEALLLDIRDEGPGIPADESERVFEPFYRAPHARAGKPGHGVGLSLVLLVARTHGAQARFLPTPKGAHLRLTFPSPEPAPP